MHKLSWWLAMAAACGLATALAQTPNAGKQDLPSPDVQLIEGKLKELEASPQLDNTAREKLSELYRNILTELRREQEHATAIEGYAAAIARASTQAKEIRRSLDHSDGASPIQFPSIDAATPLEKLEQLLEIEKAMALAAETELKEIYKTQEEESKRPAAIRTRLAEIEESGGQRQENGEAEAQAGVPPATAQAQEWLLEAQRRAAEAERERLRQELLSQPARMELLDARRLRAEQYAEYVRTRIAFLERTLAQRRVVEAERAEVEAQATKRQAAGKHPLIAELAQRNADLSEQVSNLAARLEEINSAKDAAQRKAKQVETDFASARAKLEVGGMSQALGRVLMEQRRTLPDARAYRREAEQREGRLAEISLLQIQHNEEWRALRRVPEYLAKLMAALDEEEAAAVEPQLNELAGKRISLLEKALSTEEAYLRALGELDFVQRGLLAAVRAYDKFLDRWLLWIRTAPPASSETLELVPQQLADLVSRENWSVVQRTLWTELLDSPVAITVVVLVLLLLWRRRNLRARMITTGTDINRPLVDSLGRTFLGLGLVVLLALPLPLLMLTAGLLLRQSLEATTFSTAVGVSLVAIAGFLFELNSLRILCARKGVAVVHFKWPEARLRPLRGALWRLMLTLLPAGFIAALLIASDRYAQGGGLGRLAFTLAMLALAYFFFRLLDPRQEPGHGFVASNPDSTLYRLRYVWAALGTGAPLVVTLLSMLGYLYSAGWLIEHLIRSVWLVTWLIIIYAVLVRWLLLSRRRLAFQAAQQRREAQRLVAKTGQEAVAAGDLAAIDIEEPKLDLVALGSDSLKLLRTLLVVAGGILLWMIWQDALPALGILDNIQLWSYTTSVTGEERQVPVTLADLALSILIAVVTIVATRNSASFLEILLLQRLSINSGTRYTVTTLANYTIVAVGIALIFGTLGGSWSEIRWIFAALGVGIGFGLQEIVANFISGLIILFERPVRVGDVVTVGDTDGVVTRIRIRATTIRNWDRKELLVPNKEFITGRLLNWSLSDQVTRILIPVGVAYGSDVDKALELMEEAAKENGRVLKDPPPLVTFEQFGDNALMLYLRSYVDSIDCRLNVKTELHLAINRKFAEAGIEISFPQRDVHLDTRQPLDIRISRGEALGAEVNAEEK
jgi:potassium efflux system protein